MIAEQERRVTILFPVNELRIGGAEQQLLELVRGLDKEQFDPIVVPLYPKGPLDSEFRSVEGVQVIDINRRNKFDPSPFWRIARLLRSNKIDILQPFLSPATFYSLIPALVVRPPVIVVTERCGVRRNRSLGYNTYRTVEDQLTQFADAVIPNSMAGRNTLIERGISESKIRTIYNGINPQRLIVDQLAVNRNRDRLGVEPSDFVVAIVASLTPAKGHEMLLKAISHLNNTGLAARLMIVGDGPLRGALEDLTAALGIDDRVQFFGFQRDVANFLAGCDLAVSASRDNEGCSNSILEAMALGTPVIATDVGGNPELVQDGITGFLVPSGDHVAMAEAIRRAAVADDERQVVITRAKAIFDERFSLRRMIVDYETLYSELLARKAPLSTKRTFPYQSTSYHELPIPSEPISNDVR